MRKEKGAAAKAISQRLHQSDKLQSKADTLVSKQAGADENGHMPAQVVPPHLQITVTLTALLLPIWLQSSGV